MDIFFSLCCGAVFCCLPLLIGIFIVGLVGSALRGSRKKYAFIDYLRSVWYWINIFTFRSCTSLFIASIFLGIALTAEELSILSTMAVFLVILNLLFLTPAAIFKFYAFLRKSIMHQKLTNVSLSRTEIIENESSVISISLKSKFPLFGYVMKMTAKLPKKLGGDLRGLATSTKRGETSFDVTIPQTRRGNYTIGPVNFIYQDLFGFSRIPLFDDTRLNLLILPEVPHIGKFDFTLSSNRLGDEKTVNRIINTEDFYTSRPYVRGDDPRRIHWKLTAKYRKLMIRLPETTTISYSKISILIHNIKPTYLNRKHKKRGLPYRTASQIALDTQIRIAAALIDFALRIRVPIDLYYFSSKKLEKFSPFADSPDEWKRVLARIMLVSKINSFEEISKIFDEESAFIFTTSESNTFDLGVITDYAKKKDIQLEFMYSPISRAMTEFLYMPKEEHTLSRARRFLSKVLFTSTYFDQTTIFEKAQDLFFKVKTRYYRHQEIEMLKKEAEAIRFVRSQGFAVRNFDNKERIPSDMEYVTKMLEQ